MPFYKAICLIVRITAFFTAFCIIKCIDSQIVLMVCYEKKLQL